MNFFMLLWLFMIVSSTEVDKLFYCQCTSCQDNGLCQPKASCKDSQFGLACQYSYERPLKMNLDDQSCKTTTNVVLGVTLHATRSFSKFMKLAFHDEATKYNLEIDGFTSCDAGSQKTLKRNNFWIMECFKVTSLLGREITFRGNGVKNLCYVYISIGKRQSKRLEIEPSSVSNFRFKNKWSLIDEHTNESPWSCFETDEQQNPSIIITFIQPVIVNSVTLHRGSDAYIKQSFYLNFANENGTEIEDEKTFADEKATKFSFGTPIDGVKSFRLGLYTGQNSLALHLCEIEFLTDCHSGVYGIHCTIRCHDSCIDGLCTTDGLCFNTLPGKEECTRFCEEKNCEEENGVCRHQCIPGFHGLMCENKCSGRCAGDGSCDVNGHCIHACKVGFWSETCNNNCSENCAGDRDCHVNGNCTHGCKVGFWNETCNNNCSENCAGDGSCHVNGNCTHGCKVGFWNETCDNKCSENCAEDGSCHVNGHCVQGCKVGFWNEACSDNCSENCAGDGSCHVNGNCTHGCKVGFWNETCDNKCNENCAGNGSCNVNGHCVQGCKVGFWNEACSDKCSPYCAQDKSCDMSSGLCIHGCQEYHLEENCYKTGLQHNKKWNCYCLNGSCDDKSDSCVNTDKCQRGWFAFSCKYRDLGVLAIMSHDELNDNNDASCQMTDKIEARWSTFYNIMWIRLVFDGQVNSTEFVITYHEAEHTKKCSHPNMMYVNKDTIDLECRYHFRVSRFEVHWSGALRVCSFYVSGGMSLLASPQVTTQLNRSVKIQGKDASSGYFNDGDVSDRNCQAMDSTNSHTATFDLKLKADIVSLVFYTDFQILPNTTYKVMLLSDKKHIVFKKTLNHSQSLVTVSPDAPIRAALLKLHVTQGSLRLCEVQLFGECGKPNYGPRCKDICSLFCYLYKCNYQGQCYECAGGWGGANCMSKVSETKTPGLEVISQSEIDTKVVESSKFLKYMFYLIMAAIPIVFLMYYLTSKRLYLLNIEEFGE